MVQIKTYLNYINGQWIPSSSGQTQDTINPANQEVIAYVQKSNVQDIDQAVDAARNAFEKTDWRKNPSVRADVLMQYANLVAANHEALSQLLSAENGKAINEARYCMWGYIDLLKYYAGQARNVKGTTYVPNQSSYCSTYREAIGVVAIIVPWNWPAFLLARSLAPALAAGNAVIVKPASVTSAISAELLELLTQVPGIPEGIVNFVTGPGYVVGDGLANSSKVDMIAFTGSVEVSVGLSAAAAKSVKKLSLELGGKSPNIVFADADLDKVIPNSVAAFTSTSGQLCMAGTRMIVQDTIYDEICKRMKEACEKLNVAAGANETCEMGPLISEEQFNTVMKYIEIGKKEGQVLTGGNRLTGKEYDKGFYVAPTIFTGLNENSKVVQEEIFGPVLVIQKFSTEEEAVRLANGTAFGLAGAVWTSDIKRSWRVAAEIKAGTVWVNTYNQFPSECEFGGYKASGLGRELGVTGLNEYTELKTINFNIG